MHEIRLKTLEFSNVQSFGNNVTSIDFVDGITLLRGHNGAGKSTIIEALTFALFGTPYRKINKGDIKNTANDKGKMRVFLDFDKILASGETITYQIERTMDNSDKVKFTISNSTDGLEKKVAGKSQKIFEDEILGFNQTIYYNIISLNTVMTTPFIDMDAGEKRKLTESIVTQQLDKYKTANKKILSDNQIKFDSASSDVIKYKRDVDEITNILIDLDKETQVDIDNLKIEIAQINNIIVENELTLNIHKKEQETIIVDGKVISDKIDSYGDIQSKISAYEKYIVAVTNIDTVKAERDELSITATEVSNEIAKLKSDVKDILIPESSSSVKIHINSTNRTLGSLTGEKTVSDKNLLHIKAEADALKSGIPCSLCGKPSTEDDIEQVKQSHRNKYKIELAENKRLIAEIDKVKLLLDEDNKKIADIEKLEASVAVINQQISTKTSSFNQYNMQISKLNTKISEMDSVLSGASFHPLDVAGVNKLIDVCKADLVILNDLKTTKVQLTSDFRLAKSRESDVLTTINSNKISKDRLESKLKVLENTDNREALVKAKDRLAGAKSDYDRAIDRVNKYSDKVAVSKYISSMFDDNGIKKIILSIFVPNLNKAIEKTLSLFEMPFAIEFDDAMNYKFSSKFGMANVYGSLSQGESRKLNFAIAIAFRDFVTNIADFKINLLVLDEVLDISTDEKTLVDMMMLTKKKQASIGNINIISHRGDVIMEYIDRIIDVQKDGLYSELNITNL